MSLPVALKIATGAGKTAVMDMLIAWQAVGTRTVEPRDSTGILTDDFLTVTPGRTIRNRLRVLLPFDPENYYDYR